jgi:H+-transporting ATPase
MDVLCTDKTGTLTCNRLTVNRIYTVGGVASEAEVLTYAAMCSKQEDMDAIDLAVLAEVPVPLTRIS